MIEVNDFVVDKLYGKDTDEPVLVRIQVTGVKDGDVNKASQAIYRWLMDKSDNKGFVLDLENTYRKESL